ncbi:MAG: hypothetical protein RJA09_1720 [Pseudomonadota bacterium]
MDDMVKAAMAKWPNVPDCYGWLGLDARGRWFMRDDGAQSAGPFAGPGSNAASRGSLLTHDKLVAFIHRNYGVDERGCWYFQNGPQRVYVELACTPWVWRLEPNGQVRSHTGVDVVVQSTWLDTEGVLYLHTNKGLGVVHTMDMGVAAEQVEAGLWCPADCVAAELPDRFGYQKSPLGCQRA